VCVKSLRARQHLRASRVAMKASRLAEKSATGRIRSSAATVPTEPPLMWEECLAAALLVSLLLGLVYRLGAQQRKPARPDARPDCDEAQEPATRDLPGAGRWTTKGQLKMTLKREADLNAALDRVRNRATALRHKIGEEETTVHATSSAAAIAHDQAKLYRTESYAAAGMVRHQPDAISYARPPAPRISVQEFLQSEGHDTLDRATPHVSASLGEQSSYPPSPLVGMVTELLGPGPAEAFLSLRMHDQAAPSWQPPSTPPKSPAAGFASPVRHTPVRLHPRTIIEGSPPGLCLDCFDCPCSCGGADRRRR